MAQRVQTLLIFGASGDLTARLLLPALGQLLTIEPKRRILLLGAGGVPMTDAQWKKTVRDAFATVQASGPAVDDVLAHTSYREADATSRDDLDSLLTQCSGVPALYFALPPAVAAASCRALRHVELPAGTQLALEKPFGTDQRSAHALNEVLTQIVPEDQIHRVDHFLGVSTMFNLLGLRFANRVLEPVWNAEHIAAVDVVYDEELGLENRAGYYDKAGALVDMIQSHLLQVLTVVTMDAPPTLGAQDLRDAKGMVLRATRLWNDDPVASSRRGRYTAGTIDGRKLPSYVKEQGVDPERETETLAEVTFAVNTWRWAGVPFTLRSGKALGERRHEIVVTFKPAQHVPTGLSGISEPTRVRFTLGPDSMTMELNINGPGDPRRIERGELTAQFGPGQLLAYGEVLSGIFDGDPSLSVRADAAEQCWRILAPVIAAWKADKVPLDDYRAGSRGPSKWKPLP